MRNKVFIGSKPGFQGLEALFVFVSCWFFSHILLGLFLLPHELLLSVMELGLLLSLLL